MVCSGSSLTEPHAATGQGKGDWRQQGGVYISTCEVARMHEFSMGQGTLQKVMEGNGVSVVKDLPATVGDEGSVSGLGRSPGEGNRYLLQYSRLGNPMDR